MVSDTDRINENGVQKHSNGKPKFVPIPEAAYFLSLTLLHDTSDREQSVRSNTWHTFLCM